MNKSKVEQLRQKVKHTELLDARDLKAQGVLREYLWQLQQKGLRSSTSRCNGCGGWMTCRGSPSRSAKVVRSTSCRRMTSESVRPSASGSLCAKVDTLAPLAREILAAWSAIADAARVSDAIDLLARVD